MSKFIFTVIFLLLQACSSSYHPVLPSVPPLGIETVNFISDNKGLLIGVSPPGFIGFDQDFREKLVDMDNWAGQRHSLVGLFVSLESSNPMHDIPAQLNLLMEYGYTPFINLTSNRSASDISAGKIDNAIHSLAKVFFNALKNNTNQKIILAPLPEMNGFWESYGESPFYFKKSYKRIRRIFSDEGVSEKNIYWSYAPNGWAREGHDYEDYYPGDDWVDILAYSSYNFGFCEATEWPKWQGFKKLHSSYLQKLSALTKNKPIIVSQMATTAVTRKGYDLGAKGRWLNENYYFLASQPRVAGVIYFNIDKECDWAVYQGGRRGVDSYRKAIKQNKIFYVSPNNIDAFFREYKVEKNNDKRD